VLTAARGADKKLITEAQVFDVFESEEALGANKKSLAVEITLQPREKTLRDDDIDAVAKRVIQAVNKATGGVIRK